jgi:hypothetical protein
LVELIKKAEAAVKSGFHLGEKNKTDTGSRHARRLKNKTQVQETFLPRKRTCLDLV